MDAESYCISQGFKLNTRPFVSESALRSTTLVAEISVCETRPEQY